MAATRIEVRGKPTDDGKLEVAAVTEDGELVFERTCENLDEAREEFGISHGQKGHDIYAAQFGPNYYLADLLSESEPKGVGMPRPARRKRRTK